MLPWTVTEKVLRAAEEMRAFYASFGFAPQTTEPALAARFPTLPTKQAGGHASVKTPKTPGRRIRPRT